MKPGVSVVICCHNSGKRLPETLRHLAAQVVEDGIPWEVVIIDNASTDDTQAVARKQWWHPTVELRVVSEPQAGLSNARQRGVDSSQYEILSFIDDDNWVCPLWIQRVYDCFSQNPEMALLGGPSYPVFEIEPPKWFTPISAFYAVGNQHVKEGDITDVPGTLLWGAGISLRKAAYEQLLKDGFFFECSDRKGSKLTSGGDSELCFALRASGWRILYDSTLTLQHFIPEARLAWSYAKRLLSGMGRSSVILNTYSIALRDHPSGPSAIQSLRESWFAQAAKSLKNLIRIFCSAPLRCLNSEEGSEVVLFFRRALGEFLGYMDLLGGYGDLIGRIRGARWNRNRARSQTQGGDL